MLYQLDPEHKEYIWGGHRLQTDFGKARSAPRVAESWELSCHPDGPAHLASGETLAEHLAQNAGAAGTNCSGLDQFPVLVKLIDAAQDLSVQVHPDDGYARKNEGQPGKTEMWYVVDCQPGASIYCGFSRAMTREQFRKAIEDNTLCKNLNRIQVKKGDVFFIRPGTIHAIGAGCLIAEVQQNSNVTYRVYDYDRRDAQGNPRALHIEKAMEVAELSPADCRAECADHLVRCPYFTVDRLQLEGSVEIEVGRESFRHFLVVDGQLRFTQGASVTRAGKGNSIFADAGTGRITVSGKGTLLITYIETDSSDGD